jgi:von Willebrand factor type A domain
MAKARNLVVAMMGTLAACAVACGGSGGSEFGEANNNGQGSGNGGEAPGFNNDPVGTTAACVSSTANAALSPVNLVFMFDKSGSMGYVPDGFDPAIKWNPVTVGMKSFFNDPGSAGINASLQFFPEGTDVTSVCGYPYAAPKVSLSPLSNATPLINAINATTPYGGTPTLPALQGAISYAKDVTAKQPTIHTAVVLVTDGEPGFRINNQNVAGCADNDITHVAAAAAAAVAGTPSIQTYVVGVGPSLDKLNEIASAGGTKAAFMVSVADPTATTSIFQNALNQIRSQTLSCDFAMPPAPAGQSIDTSRVNVAYSPGGGAETVLPYSADCSNPQGWHYDNLAAPTKILLCQGVCTTVQGDRQGKLTLAFGCLTKQTTK